MCEVQWGTTTNTNTDNKNTHLAIHTVARAVVEVTVEVGALRALVYTRLLTAILAIEQALYVISATNVSLSSATEVTADDSELTSPPKVAADTWTVKSA